MIRFVDIFCGAGLGARGAIGAGCIPCAGVDGWNIAAKTYAENFPTAKVYCTSIDDLNPELLDFGAIDLLLASPECTSHSPAKGSAPRSDMSRDTAFATAVWAKALKPRWIVMENVPQMRSWERYRGLLDELVALGYAYREAILDSSKFGVPQVRKRLFVTLEYGNEPPDITVPTRRRVHTAREVLDSPGTWKSTKLKAEGRAIPTLRRAEAAISALGSKSSFLLVYYGSDGGGGWQSLDEPLRTITTLDRFALVEYRRSGHYMRMLQPSELSRAMGLTTKHKFNHGSRRDKVKLCGNGICAPVMKHVVKTLIQKDYRAAKCAA